ncbi:MAG: hypothetical protein K6T31_02535, partial [Alicyclobacillus sp.]|nr:hypothetical protein [Alicyclobacillus sp.]
SGATGSGTLGPTVTVATGQSVTFNVQFVGDAANVHNLYYSEFQAPVNGGLQVPNSDPWYVVLTSSSGAQGQAVVNYQYQNPGNWASGSTTVNSSVGQTVTYTAALIDPNGVTHATETFQITWVGVSVSANPTVLPVGQTSTITVTAYAPSSTVTLYSTAPVIPGEDQVCQGSDGSCQNLWYITIGPLNGSKTYSATYTYPQGASVTFYATTGSNGSLDYTQSNQVTVTWTATGSSLVSVQLTANPASLPVGQATTLTATVPSSQWQKYTSPYLWILDTTTGQTVGTGYNSTYTTTYTSQAAETDTFIAYMGVPGASEFAQSNTVSVTWAGQQPSPPGSGGGGQQCPPLPPAPSPNPPYDTNVYWTSDGNGNQTLHWTYVYYTVEATYGTDANGCQTVTYQQVPHDVDEQQDYPESVSSGQISGLSYDPGTPNYMWFPVPSQQWDPAQCPSIFCDLYQQHGWTGYELGGPDANQISSNVTINGQVFHTYGPPIGQQTPTVWVRVDGGFGFRYVWTGSPDAIPTGGTVRFTMTNPDGGSITWTKPLILNTETLLTQGTDLLGLNDPPPPASEVFSCWTDIPKGVYMNGQPEEAAWSLSNDPATAFAQGAHISFSITVNTPAGDFTVSAPNVASTLGVPEYWFTRLEDDSLLQQAQAPQTYTPLGTIYGDPSVGLPPGNSTRLGY